MPVPREEEAEEATGKMPVPRGEEAEETTGKMPVPRWGTNMERTRCR